jgi:hypothetical protein
MLLLCLLLLPLCNALKSSSSSSSSYTLSAPRLLLPAVSPALERIRFNLSASAGCYGWKSQRTDAVRMLPLTGTWERD